MSDYTLLQDPKVDTSVRSPHKHWKLLRRDNLIDEIILQPGSFLKEKEIKQIKYQYFAQPELITKTIDRDTLFWYPPGLHEQPYNLKGKEKIPVLPAEIAGIYLQGVIPKPIQDQARNALRSLGWKPPKRRKETRAGIARQQSINGVAACELTMGFTDYGTIEMTNDLQNNVVQFAPMETLLKTMNAIYSRTLSVYFGKINKMLPEDKRWEIWHKQNKERPEYGGCLEKLRVLGTAFSTVTLLKSCPAAIHKDVTNARKDQSSFTCLTTIREDDFKGGGEFCLIEYGLKIPVKPGDILIAQTTRDWHTNLTPVQGTKYSVVAYYKRGLANPNKEWRFRP